MRNLQIELDKIIQNLQKKPRLMLHACCAPCSSYVVEYLKNNFEIFLFYYNPNIAPLFEYELRKKEAEKLCEHFGINFLCSDWENEKFKEISKGLENCKEGGERCTKCFELRLAKTAELAEKYNCEYFATTLSISPMKNAQLLCDIGEKIASETNAKYLPSNFKKKEGFKRSTEISKELGLYRQNYCGCIFSKKESEERLSIHDN
ncbi:MAG: epoxyqueuosine reductase QueH [Clostridia bacterium]